ncbi:MAG: putative manganese transporter [Huintestinicola sp.]
MDLILDIVPDAVIDTVKMLPFLYAAFLIMEAFEHHAGGKLADFLGKAGKSYVGGPAAGAVLGCIPQCGFSVAAANLYSGRLITPGTLAAVFIATSDEAIPILLAEPEISGTVWKLILVKIIAAVIFGILFDLIYKLFRLKNSEEPFEELCADCGCENHSIFYSALKHTVSITVFILIVNLILGAVIGFAGEDKAFAFLEKTGVFQPFITALIGLIPNCAASVAITELYAAGGLSFGAAAGGLCTGAGMGLAVLFRTNKNTKENFIFLGYLYLTGVACGLILNIFAK